jgi:hypothetical protein
MTTPPIDYEALAKQAGAVSSTPAPKKVDYTALAKQAGAVSTTPAALADGTGMPDASKVAGAGSMGLPGIPAPPNPIENPESRYIGNPKDQAVYQKMTQGDKQTQQFKHQAVSDVKDAGRGLADNFNDWRHNDHGVQAVVHPIVAGLKAASNMIETPYAAAGTAISGHPIAAMQSLSGGDPEKAEELDKQGNVGGAFWERWGKPIAFATAGEVAGDVMGAAGDAFRGERFANNNMTNLIAPGFVQGELPYEAAANLRPYYQKEWAAMGGGDENKLEQAFTGTTPTRNTWGGKPVIPETVTGMQKVRDLADKVVDRIDSRVNGPDGVMAQAAKDPVPQTVRDGIVNDLKAAQKKAKEFGSSYDKAYDPLIKQVQDAKDYGSLNTIKKNANNMIEGALNGKTPSEMAAASIEPVMAWKNAGNSIRDHMYPELQRYVAPPGTPGYFNIADTGRLEAQAMDARDGIYKNYYASGMQNVPEISKKYLEHVGEGSLYKTHIVRRALDLFPTPAGKFNQTFHRAMGKIGEGAAPETVAARKAQRKLQPPSAPGLPDLRGGAATISPYDRSGIVPSANVPPRPSYPGRFDVPTNMPTQTVGVSPPAQVTTQKAVGTIHEHVPNPDYSPIEGPSHFQQRKELGTSASTIPDRVRGAQSPARVRADEIGIGHIPPGTPHAGINPPLRAITGEPTLPKTKTDWMQITGTNHEPSMIADNGAAVLRTADPNIAKESLDNMRKFNGSEEYKKLPLEQQKVHDEILKKLEGQVKEYNKWNSNKSVTPPPGKEPYFEVWINPGQAGKVKKIYWKKRVLANELRMAGQGALPGGPGSGQSMQDIQAEEERRMRQEQ